MTLKQVPLLASLLALAVFAWLVPLRLGAAELASFVGLLRS